MSAYAQGRPEPIKTIVKRHKSGLAQVELVLHESQVPDCTRCPSRRCAAKINQAVVDVGGILSCSHRMPINKVNAFIFGPTTIEPASETFAEIEPGVFPREASMGIIELFGQHAMVFAWSAKAWEIEPRKPDAWPIRDGRLLIVFANENEKAPRLEARLWAGRAGRFQLAKDLDVEVNMDGTRFVYTVSPWTDDKIEPSPRAHRLTGKGGIPAVEIVCRADIFWALNS